MATRDENLGNPLLGVATDLTSFLYSRGVLRSLAEGPTRGYFLPIPGYSNLIYPRVKRINWTRRVFTPRGFSILGKPNYYARTKASKMSFKMARKIIAGKVAGETTRSIAGKVMIGKAAGLAVGAINLYLATWIPMMAWQGVNAISRGMEVAGRLDTGGYFPETRRSATSRQRAVRAISESQLQARSALGNEARLFHR